MLWLQILVLVFILLVSDTDFLEQLKICTCRQSLCWSQPLWSGWPNRLSHGSLAGQCCMLTLGQKVICQMWLTPLIYWSQESDHWHFQIIARVFPWKINEMCSKEFIEDTCSILFLANQLTESMMLKVFRYIWMISGQNVVQDCHETGRRGIDQIRIFHF